MTILRRDFWGDEGAQGAQGVEGVEGCGCDMMEWLVRFKQVLAVVHLVETKEKVVLSLDETGWVKRGAPRLFCDMLTVVEVQTTHFFDNDLGVSEANILLHIHVYGREIAFRTRFHEA